MTAIDSPKISAHELVLIARVELLAREQLGEPIPKGLRELAGGDTTAKVER